MTSIEKADAINALGGTESSLRRHRGKSDAPRAYTPDNTAVDLVVEMNPSNARHRARSQRAVRPSTSMLGLAGGASTCSAGKGMATPRCVVSMVFLGRRLRYGWAQA